LLCPVNLPPPPAPCIGLKARFAKRLDLTVRFNRAYERSVSHPWRPRAMASFQSANWLSLFECLDPTFAGGSIEWRHPYLDLRMLQFMLRVPPLPLSRGKNIIRLAMRGKLPDEILYRPKTPLQPIPLWQWCVAIRYRRCRGTAQ